MDPQVQAEGIFADLEHDKTGPQSFVGPVLEMSKTPTAARMAAPPLARDTRAVMAEAGYSGEEIEDLVARNVVDARD